MAGGDRKNADSLLIAALAGGSTIAAAAQRAGVSERTVWRRLDDPAFVARLDAAKQQTVQAAIDRLAAGATDAATTLVGLLEKEQPPSIRLRAAVAILEVHHKYVTAADLEARIAALEENGRQA